MKNFHYQRFTEIYSFKDIRHLTPVFGPISTTYYCLRFMFTGVDVRKKEVILQDCVSNDGNKSILLLVLLEKQPCQHTTLNILGARHLSSQSGNAACNGAKTDSHSLDKTGAGSSATFELSSVLERELITQRNY